MAIGFPPRYTYRLSLHENTAPQFLVLAMEMARTMLWTIGFHSETGFIAYTNYSSSRWNSVITVIIGDGMASVTSATAGSALYDSGRNKRLVEDYCDSIIDLRLAITPEELDQKFEVISHDLALPESDILNQAPPSNWHRIRSGLTFLIPKEGYFITPILFDLNILVYLVMVFSGVSIFSPDWEELLPWGANFRPITMDGQPWRLLTALFVHAGFYHLLMNSFALLLIGFLIESHLGKARFLAAYLLCGIMASITSLWWHDNTSSVGASGAIFGLYGVYLAMLTTRFFEEKNRLLLLISVTIFVIYNLINGLKPGIDNAAHVGGLFSGLVIGYAFFPSLKFPWIRNLKWASIGLMSLLILTFSFLIFRSITIPLERPYEKEDQKEVSEPATSPLYDARMRVFYTNESQALEVLNLSKGTPTSQILSALKNRGLYYWEENRKIVTEADTLDLPKETHFRNRLLLEYCDLRILNYQLMYKSYAENSDRYNDSIRYLDDRIEGLLKTLEEE